MRQRNSRGSPSVKYRGGTHSVPYLVAMAFCPPPAGADVVTELTLAHLDGDGYNCRADNLHWVPRGAAAKSWAYSIKAAVNTAVWQMEAGTSRKIAMFRSASEAARVVLRHVALARNIRYCVDGTRSTCGGFAWARAAPEEVKQYLTKSDGSCLEAIFLGEDGQRAQGLEVGEKVRYGAG